MTSADRKPPIRYLGVTDVADTLGCSLKTVYRLTDSGVLKAYRLGSRTRRYRLDEVVAAMENRQMPTIGEVA